MQRQHAAEGNQGNQQGEAFPDDHFGIKFGVPHSLPADGAKADRQQVGAVTEGRKKRVGDVSAENAEEMLGILGAAGGTPAGVGVVVAEEVKQQQAGAADQNDVQHVGDATTQVIVPAFARIGRRHGVMVECL